MLKRSVTLSFWCVLFVFCFSLVSQNVFAQQVTLKVSHQFAKGDVRDEMCRVFGDKVEEMTDGDVKFRYYPASALFKAKEQWDALKRGAVDMALFPLDYASGKVPQLSITLMPCAVQNIEQGMSWSDKEVGKEIDKLVLDHGIRNLVWAWFSGGMGSTKRQIKVPSDVDGLKMRAAGKKFEYMLKEAGASISSMASSELYQALSTGVLDSCMTSAASFVSYRLYEQLDYANVPVDYSIWYMAENLLISEKTWEKLSKEQKDAFNQTAEWMEDEWVVENFAALADEMDEEYRNAGAEVHHMTKEEFEKWQDFAEETAWKDFAEEVENGQKYIDLAVDAMN